MSKKFFPIKTETSCRLKWAWSTLFFSDGSTTSCYRASNSSIPDNFADFHNTTTKIRDRELMLQGQWPQGGCDECRVVEEVGGISERLYQLDVPDVYPEELDNNPTLTSVNPTVLEIFFSNICNQKCVYCSSMFSSSIQDENRKYGGAILKEYDFNYTDNKYAEISEKFWPWFYQNSKSLKRLHILGGEPFLMSDLDKMIDYLKMEIHPNLELNIVTNLSLNYDIIKNKLARLHQLLKQRRIKELHINVSAECWGSPHEYIRYGSKCDVFERNLKELLLLKGVRVSLLSTINALSLPSMIDLVRQRASWIQTKNIAWYMFMVGVSGGNQQKDYTESVFSPIHFDYSVWEPYIAEIQENLSSDSFDNQNTKNLFDGIASYLQKNCSTNLDYQQRLFNFLNENDIRRGTDWKQVFPWIEEVFRKNHVV